MAKYEIKFICGHTETRQLYGPHRDRERKIEWLENGICSTCWRAKKQAERNAQNKASAETNQALALPELTGSPKQIGWAESIRTGVLAPLVELDAKIAACTGDLGPAGKVWPDFVLWIKGQNKAGWWIDHRTLSFEDTLDRAKAGSAEHTMGLLGYVLDGRGTVATWQDFWQRWLEDHHPDVVAAIKDEAERAAVKKEAEQSRRAAEYNRICGEAAAAVTEADCEFDDFGNWRAASVNGVRFENGFYANEIGAINGVSQLGSTLRARGDCKNIDVLQAKISEITIDRRQRIDEERQLVYNRDICSGQVATVERTRKRTDNTIVTLDNGRVLTVTVPRKDSDWAACFEDQSPRALAQEFRRIGQAAKELFINPNPKGA